MTGRLKGWCVLAVGTALVTLPARAVDTTAPGYREVERVVAVVNSDVVLLSEVEEQVAPLVQQLPTTLKGAERQRKLDEIRKDVMDGLVADRLMQQQVEQLGVDVTSEELERAIHEVKTQNGLDDATFKQALSQQGMTMGRYRETLRKQLLRAKIINIKVRSRVAGNEAELEGAVARRMRTRKVEYRLHVRHALFLLARDAEEAQVASQLARAEEFQRRAAAGEDWATLARELSDPPTQSGGDLGFFRRGEMMPEFEEAAFKAEVGHPTAPVRTPVGWHVVEVLEKKSLDGRTPEQIREDIREQLVTEELERAFKRYVSELRNQAHVEIR